MKRLLAIATAITLSLAAVPAIAQRVKVPSLPDRHSIAVGSGVLSYFDGGAPGSGPAWDVRYAYRIFPNLSIEAGYTGAASEAAISGAVVASIFQGDARFHPFATSLRQGRLDPYFLAGAGWGAFSGTDTTSDNGTFVVPLGLGADYGISDRLMAGGRFTYHLVANDHIGELRTAADNWALIARLGAKF